MPVLLGEEFAIEVQLADNSWVEVADMNSFSHGSSRDIATFPVFQRTVPHSIPGPREQTMSVGGYLNSDDPGQARLRAASAGNLTVNIRVYWAGTTNGFTQVVRVGSTGVTVSPEGLQETTFELAAAEAPVIVGTGPLP